MGEYRHIETGELKSQSEWRQHYKNTSLPRTWTAATLQGLGLEPVLEAPKPTDLGTYQTVRRDGVSRDASGNWVRAWAVVDMFSDYVDEEGNTVTKAEQEQQYQARLDAEAAKRVRAKRDKLLVECDWVVIRARELGQDVPREWFDYRSDLRNVPQQDGFPHDVEWPTHPAAATSQDEPAP
jgi:hypothetical protein